MPKKISLAYAAGFVDGEGCISLIRQNNSLVPIVYVTNTNLEILQDFQYTFGGTIIKHNVKNKPDWKTRYMWQISNAVAMSFLEKIEPYLRIKKEQTMCLFAYAEIRPGTGGKWTNALVEARDLLKDQINWLNKKGSSDKGKSPIDKVLEEIEYAF